MKTRLENPKGLHQRYVVRKIELHPNPLNTAELISVTAPVNPDANYFVLRLDDMQSDPYHKEACIIAVNSYADAIEPHLPQLASELRDRYPIS